MLGAVFRDRAEYPLSHESGLHGGTVSMGPRG